MRPPDVVAHELAREWLAKADVDLSAARALLATDAHFDTVAFHAQQAAALTPYGVDYRYPGDYPAVSRQMAEASLATAGLVVTSVAERLSVDHPTVRE